MSARSVLLGEADLIREAAHSRHSRRSHRRLHPHAAGDPFAAGEFSRSSLEILGYEHIVELARGRFYADATRSIEYGADGRILRAEFRTRAGSGRNTSPVSSRSSAISSIPIAFFENNLRRAGVKNFLPAYARIDDSQHAAQQLARPLQKLALFLDDTAARVHPSGKTDRLRGTLPRVRRVPVIAIHPGSGSPRKNWPAENWAALARWLVGIHPARRDAARRRRSRRAQIGGSCASRPAPEPNVLLAQNLPLPHLAAVLQRCRLFLGHDSGISHLAAAVGTPVRAACSARPTPPCGRRPIRPSRLSRAEATCGASPMVQKRRERTRTFRNQAA